jgi:phenol 2-monooxygenase
MVIPREHNMVRLYIQLQKTPRDPSTETQAEKAGTAEESCSAKKANRVDRSKITPELILESANKIFYPYKLDMVDMKWYTAYQIGQRTATNFQKSLRVFIAGDACHTHSPKAGQGMNVSMMDTYNLGWKIALVCRGFAHPRILETYEAERRRTAENLIAYDYKLSRLFSGKPNTDGSGTGVDLEEFQEYFEQGCKFASGCIVDYQKSCLVTRPEVKLAADDFNDPEYCLDLAKNVPIGRRFDTAQVMCQSDTRPWELADRMPSDGRFRILYFAGDVRGNKRLYEFMNKLGDYLSSDKSVIKKFTPCEGFLDSVIDVLLIHASKRTSIEWDEFPLAFRPRDFKGRMNYFKIFADDETYHQGHGHAYEKYGIRPGQGCIIVVRPDGHVGTVVPANDCGIQSVEKYFENILVEPKLSWVNNGGFCNTNVDEGEWYGKPDYGYPVLGYGGPLLSQ